MTIDLLKKKRKRRPRPLVMRLTTKSDVLIARVAGVLALNDLDEQERRNVRARAISLLVALHGARP